MGLGGSKWQEVAPSTKSVAFRTFKELVPKSTDDETISKFIIKACISAILCDVIYVTPCSRIASELTKWRDEYPGWFQCQEYQLSHSGRDSAGSFFGVFQFPMGTFVVVRGTIGPADWADNFTLDAVRFLSQNDCVHAGFLQRSASVPWEIVKRHAATLKNDLVLTGHSLGGAAAVLAATRMLAEGDDVQTFTFGQPSCFYKEVNEFGHGMAGKMRERVHRFHFDDDYVPTSPHRYNEHCVCPENLLLMKDRMEDGPSLAQAERMSMPSAANAIQNHEIERYRKALLKVASPRPGATPKEQPCLREEKGLFDIVVDRIKAWHEAVSDGSTQLWVRGEGLYTGFVDAALYDLTADHNIVPSAKLVKIHFWHKYPLDDIIEPENIPVREDELIVFEVVFDVTDVNYTDDKLMLRASNGFHEIQREISVDLNNVAVVGKPAHGKSHLIRALKARANAPPHSSTPAYPPAEARNNVGVNDHTQSEKFSYGKMTFYEIPGVSNNDWQHLQQVKKNIDEYPPRIVLIVFEADGAMDNETPDFDTLVQAINEDIRKNPEKPACVKIVLVLTKCANIGIPDWDRAYDKKATDLKERFQLPQNTKHFMVNAADPRGNNANVFGIDELYLWIEEQLETKLGYPVSRGLFSRWSLIWNVVKAKAATYVPVTAGVAAAVLVPEVGPLFKVAKVGMVAASGAIAVYRDVWAERPDNRQSSAAAG